MTNEKDRELNELAFLGPFEETQIELGGVFAVIVQVILNDIEFGCDVADRKVGGHDSTLAI